ncbi:hypothetical protein [Nocardia sp. NPDC056000]|uniref:hypothetical protein n=1 Tax=Nocardia sp. NPDC056000 TaxID=3345674 RepID=UPI0035E1E601
MNRDAVFLRFDELLAESTHTPKVLLTGIGGIGKSRLLAELKARAGKEHASNRSGERPNSGGRCRHHGSADLAGSTDIAQAIEPFVAAAPRLRWESAHPTYQIQDFIIGDLLDDIAPRGRAVPDCVPRDVPKLFADLRRIPAELLPTLPSSSTEDPPAFAHRLSDITERAYQENQHRFGSLFRSLGVPENPLATLLSGWSTLEARPFRLVHADVHRKNMIIQNGIAVVFLD